MYQVTILKYFLFKFNVHSGKCRDLKCSHDKSTHLCAQPSKKELLHPDKRSHCLSEPISFHGGGHCFDPYAIDCFCLF